MKRIILITSNRIDNKTYNSVHEKLSTVSTGNSRYLKSGIYNKTLCMSVCVCAHPSLTIIVWISIFIPLCYKWLASSHSYFVYPLFLQLCKIFSIMYYNNLSSYNILKVFIMFKSIFAAELSQLNCSQLWQKLHKEIFALYL